MIEYLRRILSKWLQIERDRQHIQHLKIEILDMKREVSFLTNQLEKNMAALDNLSKAVADLQNVVDTTVTTLNTPHPTEAQVQSAAEAVQAQIARLQAALPAAEPAVV
jgi:chromosome segregation ATPase